MAFKATALSELLMSFAILAEISLSVIAVLSGALIAANSKRFCTPVDLHAA
jgi:hypothetical protein